MSEAIMRSSEARGHETNRHGPIVDAILRLISDVPPGREAPSGDPEARSLQVARVAARRAALLAGSLALPPGPLGWLTLVPELFAVWRIQARMIADIASAHGQVAPLGREQMMYCLFRHAAAQAARDVAVRIGERVIFREASSAVVHDVARRAGAGVVRRVAGKGAARFLPLIGAAAVGAYAYWDTMQVARTALLVFRQERDAKGR